MSRLVRVTLSGVNERQAEAGVDPAPSSGAASSWRVFAQQPHARPSPDPLRGVDLWLVDGLVVPASLHDVEGRFVHMNAAAERASGKSSVQMLGHLFTKLLPPEARENVEAQFRRAVEDGTPTDFETVFVDAAGRLRSVRAQHLPLRRGDTIVGVLILAFDARYLPSAPSAPQIDPQPRLTPRQSEILNLIASGFSTSETARKLTLSTETVRNHLRGVFRELHAHSRMEAIAAAQRLGLLAAPALGSQPDADVRPGKRGDRPGSQALG
jgi:PAS domain S-box-containing protein